MYTYLINFETVDEAYIHLDGLANQLKRHKNGIISCISQARKNPRIYLELILNKYVDSDIPDWFIRPHNEKETDETPVELLQESPIIDDVKPQKTATNIPSLNLQNYRINVIDYSEIEQVDYGIPTPMENMLNQQVTNFENQQVEQFSREHEEWRNLRIERTEDPDELLNILLENAEYRYQWSHTTLENKISFKKLLELLFSLNREKKQDEKNNQALINWYSGRYYGLW